jgi:hypothetical protein
MINGARIAPVSITFQTSSSQQISKMPRQRTRKLAASPIGRPPAPIPSAVSDSPSTDLRRRQRWRRVEKAREFLDQSALKIMRAMVDKAIAGDSKAAAWLLAHTAVEKDGKEVRPVAASIDRPAAAVDSPDTAPRILIGVNLGADFARLSAHQPSRGLLAAVTADDEPSAPE